MFKSLILIVITSLAAPVWAHEGSYQFKRNIVLWEKHPDQQIPAQIGKVHTFDETLLYPESLGSLTRAEKTYREGAVQFTIQFFWIRPDDAMLTDYWVTQSKIEIDGIGVIAECSRYNEPKPGHSVGIGACSGRLDQRQIGVTLQ
jgi:hypothetical protein